MTPRERQAIAELAIRYDELAKEDTWSQPTRLFFLRQAEECRRTLTDSGYQLLNNRIRKVRIG